MLLKTLHWNIGGGKIRRVDADQLIDDSYRAEGLSYVIEMIKKFSPDIVTLVETHADEKRTQAGEVAKAIRLPYFQNEVIADSHVEAGQKLGMAVISRFPITHSEFLLFKNPGFIYMKSGKIAHDKGTLHSTIDIGGRSVEVVATHLVPFRRVNVDPASPEGSDVLRDVAQKLMPKSPVALVQGDFNINSATLRPFLPELFDAGIHEVPLSGSTTPKGHLYDHVLYRGLHVQSSKVVTDVLTDHFPVYSEFEFIIDHY